MQRKCQVNHRNEKILMPFETLFKDLVDENRLSAADFMVRLETVLIIAAAKGMRFSDAIFDWWDDFFPEINFCDSIRVNAIEYMERNRVAMKLVSGNEYIRNDKTRLKALIPLVTILGIGNSGVVDDNLIIYISNSLKEVKDDERTVYFGTAEVLQQLSCPKGKKIALGNITIMILNENKALITRLLDELKQPLLYKGRHVEGANDQPIAYEELRFKSPRKSPMEFARMVCLVEKCLQEGTAAKRKEQLIKAHWQVAFDGVLCTEDNLDEFLRYMRKNPFLDALSFLFRYPVEEIRNDRIVRMIAIVRTVNSVFAHSPSLLPKEALIESSLLLYGQFNVVSNGLEEKDIADYLGCFLSSDSHIDERVMSIFRQHKNIIEINYKNTQEGLMQSRTRNYYVEAIQSRNDKQIAELQEQVAGSRFAVLSRLIDMLSCPSYGYLLGKVYRIAYGHDKPDGEAVVTLCKDLLQVLRMFEIVPTNEELIGIPYNAIDNEECKIILDRFTGYPNSEVVYPGWRVEDDVVALPIATDDE